MGSKECSQGLIRQDRAVVWPRVQVPEFSIAGSELYIGPATPHTVDGQNPA